MGSEVLVVVLAAQRQVGLTMARQMRLTLWNDPVERMDKSCHGDGITVREWMGKECDRINKEPGSMPARIAVRSDGFIMLVREEG
jgi:hypothetical protein